MSDDAAFTFNILSSRPLKKKTFYLASGCRTPETLASIASSSSQLRPSPVVGGNRTLSSPNRTLTTGEKSTLRFTQESKPNYLGFGAYQINKYIYSEMYSEINGQPDRWKKRTSRCFLGLYIYTHFPFETENFTVPSLPRCSPLHIHGAIIFLC